MKMLLQIAARLALAISLTIGAAIADDTLNGNWRIRHNIAGNDSEITCTFAQNGAELTGNCEAPAGKVQLAGKIDGKTVTWSYKSQHEGQPLTVNYKGAVDTDKITGTVGVPEYAVEGEFQATRAAN